jgi:hypothetical protein
MHDRGFEVVGAIGPMIVVRGVFLLSGNGWRSGIHRGKCLEFGWVVCGVYLFFTKIWVGRGMRAPTGESMSRNKFATHAHSRSPKFPAKTELNS